MSRRALGRRAWSGPRRAGALLAVAALLAVPALAGCQAPGGAKASASCDTYQLADGDNTGTTYPMLVLLLDVNDNSAATAKKIAATMRPYFDAAVRDGEYIRLVASGGENSGLAYSPCFTGTNVFKVDRHNGTRQKKDRKLAGEALETQVDHTVQQVRVSPTGSVTALLADVDHEIDGARSTPGIHVGKVTVLVWSDLLGKTTGPDCLNVDGKEASPSIAEGLVRRCFATKQLTALDGDTVRFLGVNASGGTGPQQGLARYLEGELCRNISTDCV